MAVHTQTGCDTVSKMFGTGKGKALNVMKKITLQCLGEKDASYTDLSQRNLLPTVMEWLKLVHQVTSLTETFTVFSCAVFKIKSSL